MRYILIVVFALTFCTGFAQSEQVLWKQTYGKVAKQSDSFPKLIIRKEVIKDEDGLVQENTLMHIQLEIVGSDSLAFRVVKALKDGADDLEDAKERFEENPNDFIPHYYYATPFLSKGIDSLKIRAVGEETKEGRNSTRYNFSFNKEKKNFSGKLWIANNNATPVSMKIEYADYKHKQYNISEMYTLFSYPDYNTNLLHPILEETYYNITLDGLLYTWKGSGYIEYQLLHFQH